MLVKAKGKTEHHMHLQESFKIKLIAETVSWMYKKNNRLKNNWWLTGHNFKQTQLKRKD